MVVDSTTARTNPRDPVRPDLENGSVTEPICFDVSVNVVADPIVVPAALTKVTDPVHDDAVPLDEAEAKFVKLISNVSVLPNPTAGNE